MKIAILTSSFPRHLGDHQGNFVWHLARRQVRQDHEVHIICPHIPGAPFHETMNGIHVHRFPYFYPYRLQSLASETGMFSAMSQSLLALFQIPLLLIGEFWCTLKIVRINRIDLLHCHWLVPSGLVGALYSYLTGIPHITSVHGSDLHLLKKNSFLRQLCRFITRNSTIITANSNYMKRQLLAVSPGYGKNIPVIPMGIDQIFPGPALAQDQKKGHGGGHLILNVGRLIDLKGTSFLIGAMPAVLAKVPDARLLVAGAGPNRDALIRQSCTLGLQDHVEFLGMVPPAELISYYPSADVFVLPSINHDGMTEGLGVVLLEAMASGCPVIGSNVGGIPDIIEDGKNGFLVPERDSAALAEKIVTLLSDTARADRFRQAGYVTIRNRFSWDIISRNFLETYKEALSRDSPRGTI